jgi:hypothetical protein
LRQIARKTGFKEGQQVRVLPVGYVADDEAADSAAALDAPVTSAPTASCAGSPSPGRPSAWMYEVTYRDLGPVARKRAQPLRTGRAPPSPPRHHASQ